jgi:hypothetical protein
MDWKILHHDLKVRILKQHLLRFKDETNEFYISWAKKAFELFVILIFLQYIHEMQKHYDA